MLLQSVVDFFAYN